MDNKGSRSIFGVPITPITLPALLLSINQAIQIKKPLVVFNVNAHCLNLAYRDSIFRKALSSASIIFVDGYGVILGSWLLCSPLPMSSRMTPPDWIDELARICVQEKYSIFLLGARPGIAQKAVRNLSERNPDLIIAGFHHGYFDKSSGSHENVSVIEKINKSKADIVLVGFGMPLQEEWIIENFLLLDAKVYLSVGALIDYLADELPRGPKILTKIGFEWMTRLLIEPRRLWRRYILGNPLFLWRILKQRLGIDKYP